MTPPISPQTPANVLTFTQRFSSTPLGARLARCLAVHQLHRWDIPHGSGASDTAALLVAELATNAATHGRVPGRDFELSLRLFLPLITSSSTSSSTTTSTTLRIDVSDTRGERRPPSPSELAVPEPDAAEESGRGLCLVEALADRWSVFDRTPVGKTVRAELDIPH